MLQKSDLNFKKVMSTVKLSLWIIWAWPMPKDTPKFKFILLKLFHVFCVIMALLLEAPTIYSIVKHINDFAMFIELFLAQAPIWHGTFNIIFHQINYHHIQNAVFEMEKFCELMKPHEEAIIRRYIDKCAIFYGGFLLVLYCMAVVVLFFTPLMLGQPYPLPVDYPFDVLYQPVQTIVYIQQCIVGILMTGALCLNNFSALVLWFGAARFQMLIEEIMTSTNAEQLKKCIKKHQEIFEFITTAITISRSYAFTCMCCSTVNLIIIGVSFFTEIPLMMRLKYISMILVCLVEAYMFAWPAEHLLFISNDVGDTVFYSDWYIKSHEIRQLSQIIITRSKKVVKLALPFITPSISMNYLTSYCATVMSYFTTLRVMLEDEEN